MMENNKSLLDLTDADLLFIQACKVLEQIKLVCGGQTLYATLRKRKILKKFMEDYVKQHHGIFLDTIEESICSL